MNTKVLLWIGGGILLLGGGYALYKYANKGKALSPSKTGGATKEQFDKFVAYKNTDMFKGATTDQLKDYLNKWTSNLTPSEADTITNIEYKGEGNWSASDKVTFVDLFKKWTGRALQGR